MIRVECKADSRFVCPEGFDKLQEEKDVIQGFMAGKGADGEVSLFAPLSMILEAVNNPLSEIEKPLENVHGSLKEVRGTSKEVKGTSKEVRGL